jgi:transposase
MYNDILRHPRDTVRRKRPEKWRTNSWFLLHDNAPAHRSVLVKDFLANNKVTKLEHPPYSPDVTTAYFSPVPRPKSALKGRRFRDVFHLSNNGMEEGRRISQNGFQHYIQHFCICWQKRIVAQRTHSE